MKHRDMIGGLFWLAIGVGISIGTLTSYEIGSLTHPGPGYLPLALGIILVLLSLSLLAGQVKKMRTPGVRPVNLADDFSGGWRKVLYTVFVLVAAALFFEQVGYLLTFFLLIVLLMKGVDRQSWKRILMTALLTTAGVYLVFVLLLQQQLPRGFWGI